MVSFGFRTLATVATTFCVCIQPCKTVGCSSRTTFNVLKNRLKRSQRDFFSYEIKSRWDLFSLFFKTLKVVRDEQPTVLHGWMHTQNVVATFAKALNPKITMVWA